MNARSDREERGVNVVDVTERLMAEFEDRLNLKHITDVVCACR